MSTAKDPASSSRRDLLRSGIGVLGAATAGAAGLGFVRPAAAVSDSSSWITQTARFKLNPDNADAALDGLRTLVAAVEKEEPGVLAYICHRSTKDTDEILFFEIYQNEEALKAHGAMPHLGVLRQNFATWFKADGGVDITRYDRIAGFTR